MSTLLHPVNKQSALFLSRKHRVETTQQALEIFAVEITGPETVSKIREIIWQNQNDKDAEVTITLKIRGDARTPDTLSASVETKLSTRIGTHAFHGLK